MFNFRDIGDSSVTYLFFVLSSQGGLFLFLCLSSILCSLACLAITAAIAFWEEYDLTMMADEETNGVSDGDEGRAKSPKHGEKDGDTIVLTGLLIEGAVMLFGLVLLICSCYGAWLNCCCESRPPKVGIQQQS